MLRVEALSCHIRETSALHGVFPLELLDGGHRDHLKTIRTAAIGLDCPPELSGKTLLLKAPHTWVKGTWSNQAGTDLEVSSTDDASHTAGVVGELLAGAGGVINCIFSLKTGFHSVVQTVLDSLYSTG